MPLTRSVSFLHPADDRPVFAFPWEGVTLVGTTDVDLDEPLRTDPAISPAEAEYLLQAAQYAFACQELTPDDVQCTYSGVRPVINTGKSDPSKEFARICSVERKRVADYHRWQADHLPPDGL